jgi:hypothetical protein
MIRNRRAHLIQAGASADDPELLALAAQIDARDAELFDRYGRQYADAPPADWIAISVTGDVRFGATSSEVARAARAAYGPGNFAVRRLRPASAPEITYAP